MDEDLDPREAARVKRRDHDHGAKERDLLRPGMGKVFKQIGDAWVRDTEEPPTKARKPARGASKRSTR